MQGAASVVQEPVSGSSLRERRWGPRNDRMVTSASRTRRRVLLCLPSLINKSNEVVGNFEIGDPVATRVMIEDLPIMKDGEGPLSLEFELTFRVRVFVDVHVCSPERRGSDEGSGLMCDGEVSRSGDTTCG